MTEKGYSTIQFLDDEDESEDEIFDASTDSTNIKFHDFSAVPSTETNSGFIKSETVNSTLNLQGSNDDDDDGEDDKKELLSDRKAPSFWTFQYYQAFFDVDTDQVLSRILGTMVPSRQNYLLTKIRPNPDLYGPFWICATLVFTIAICGNLSSFFASEGTHKWHSNFQLVSLSACVIYGYAWVVPTVLWGYLIWRGNLAGYSFLELVCVYGYSLAIFIPISVLWVAPYDWWRWLLVVVGVCLSGSVLAMTFWRAVEDDSRKYAIITITFVLLLHFLLALGFKLYFFKSIKIHESVYHQVIVNTTTLAPTKMLGTTNVLGTKRV